MTLKANKHKVTTRMTRHSPPEVSSFLWAHDCDGSGNSHSAKKKRLIKKDMKRSLRAHFKRVDKKENND